MFVKVSVYVCVCVKAPVKVSVSKAALCTGNRVRASLCTSLCLFRLLRVPASVCKSFCA